MTRRRDPVHYKTCKENTRGDAALDDINGELGLFSRVTWRTVILYTANNAGQSAAGESRPA